MIPACRNYHGANVVRQIAKQRLDAADRLVIERVPFGDPREMNDGDLAVALVLE
jgi:hypothetical protein